MHFHSESGFILAFLFPKSFDHRFNKIPPVVGHNMRFTCDETITTTFPTHQNLKNKNAKLIEGWIGNIRALLITPAPSPPSRKMLQFQSLYNSTRAEFFPFPTSTPGPPLLYGGKKFAFLKIRYTGKRLF